MARELNADEITDNRFRTARKLWTNLRIMNDKDTRSGVMETYYYQIEDVVSLLPKPIRLAAGGTITKPK